MKNNIKLIMAAIYCLLVLTITPTKTRAEDGIARSKDGTLISYSTYGKGNTTLLFIHGWSCNRSFWREQIPTFEKKYRVIAMDLAGHGDSEKNRIVYSMESFAEDVAAVVKTAQAKNVILIGHSLSGAIILKAAEMYPDNIIGLIGIDTMQNFDEEYTPEQAEELIKPFKEDFKKATDGFVRAMFLEDANPKLVDEIASTMSGASDKVGISAFEEMLKMSYVKNPPKINVPVWCLNAEIWPTKPEVNRKYLPDFNLRLISGVGHFLMLEAPDEFNKELEKIIQEIAPDKITENNDSTKINNDTNVIPEEKEIPAVNGEIK